MAKFAYRMQSILDIKEKMEGQAKIAYGVANAKLMDEQGKLQQIMIRKAGYESQARNLVNGTIDVPTSLVSLLYIESYGMIASVKIPAGDLI